VRDRLALGGKRAGSYFNHQVVESIQGKDGPIGFIRITLDTHVLGTESKQVDNTTNLLRLMILLALAIGIILARTLLQGRRSRWQQSPYLLTANTPVAESDDDKPEEEETEKKE
jgi:membrane protein